MRTSTYIPKWVEEGGADWLAAMAIEEIGETPDGANYDDWLDSPQTDLFARAYDGVGFFAMLQQAGVDTWSRYREMMTAVITQKKRVAEFLTALGGVPKIFYDRWGPGFTRDDLLGPAFDLAGPGLPATDRRSSRSGTASCARRPPTRGAPTPPR